MEINIRETMKSRLIPEKKRMLFKSLATLGLHHYNLDALIDLRQQDFKTAYKRLVLLHHPDRWASVGGEIMQKKHDQFLRLQSAVETLYRFMESRDQFAGQFFRTRKSA